MLITIRDKHSGYEKDFDEVYEVQIDSINISIVKEFKKGGKKPYYFDKRDYEIAYVY